MWSARFFFFGVRRDTSEGLSRISFSCEMFFGFRGVCLPSDGEITPLFGAVWGVVRFGEAEFPEIKQSQKAKN